MGAYLQVHMSGGKKRVSDHLEPESWVIVSFPIRVPEIRFGPWQEQYPL